MMNNKGYLYIMIGLPASGKDFMIKKMLDEGLFLKNKNCTILSSDEIRVELFDWEDQTQNALVFEEMNKRCKDALSKGNTVIYNATNINRKRRTALIQMMKKYINKVFAICCLCPLGVIYERNLCRTERYIPEHKILEMLRSIDIPLRYEPFDEIFFVNTDTVGEGYKFYEWLLSIGTGYDQKNIHHNDTLLEHLKLTQKKVYEYDKEDFPLQMAGRLHDVGKPYTREWNEEKKCFTYYGHQNVSTYLVALLYTYESNDIIKLADDAMDILILIYHHMDKFCGNLEKTRLLLGEGLYKRLETLMMSDAFRKEK